MSNDNKLSQEDVDLRYKILKGCIERMDTLEFKGKRRDSEALTYLCGAATALDLINHKLSQNMVIILTMIFSVRGAYSQAARMIEEYENPKGCSEAA